MTHMSVMQSGKVSRRVEAARRHQQAGTGSTSPSAAVLQANAVHSVNLATPVSVILSRTERLIYRYVHPDSSNSAALGLVFWNVQHACVSRRLCVKFGRVL